MDKDDHPDPPCPPHLSVPPRPPPETLCISPLNLQPVQPPPTPTLLITNTDSSPSSSHRRKRSKLTRIDLPPPPSSTTAITTTTNTEGASTSTSTPAREDVREVANSLLLLGTSFGFGGGDDRAAIATTPARFECSSCKKTFPTHQALGGHRASHKNVKGCFAITKSGVEEEGSTSVTMEGHNYNFTGNTDMVPRLGLGFGLGLAHRCGICSKVFTSGQALGGHMRCHGEKNEEASTSSFGPRLGPVTQPAEAQRGFDLNLPAEVEEDEDEDEGPPDCSTSDDTELDLRLGL